MTSEEKNKLLDTLPERFGLRAFAGKQFMVDRVASFYSHHSDTLQVVVDVKYDGHWQYFARSSYAELLKEVTE